jgi:hypothetical protein
MKPFREPLSVTSSYPSVHTQTTIWRRFINWCAGHEERKFFWLGLSLAGHGCFITVLTIFAILFSGNQIIFWPFAMAAMVSCLVVNLAALPTKITIPVFFAGVLVDIIIIALCITNGIRIDSIFQ